MTERNFAKEIDELKAQIEKLKNEKQPYHTNEWFRRYGEYVNTRVKDYGYVSDSSEKRSLYSRVRSIARLRYFGGRTEAKATTYWPPQNEEQYLKMIGFVDQILPSLNEVKP